MHMPLHELHGLSVVVRHHEIAKLLISLVCLNCVDSILRGKWKIRYVIRNDADFRAGPKGY